MKIMLFVWRLIAGTAILALLALALIPFIPAILVMTPIVLGVLLFIGTWLLGASINDSLKKRAYPKEYKKEMEKIKKERAEREKKNKI